MAETARQNAGRGKEASLPVLADGMGQGVGRGGRLPLQKAEAEALQNGRGGQVSIGWRVTAGTLRKPFWRAPARVREPPIPLPEVP